MKSTLSTLALLFASADASVLFALSPDTNGGNAQKSWVVNRWTCHDLAIDNFDNQASWAFVEGGLANGCQLYDNNNCTGNSVYIEKNNSNILGPGPVNLVDVGFDKVASSFQCF
ncbi:hypothetical protein HBI56_104040 [Parastagonospora nodorum]|nr:hypothetical protein HBH92_066370 [Parastagonospora nodorum]KAH4444246.1 hypothetical protein HBH93_065250 [Parastagonospora nodorum]KAH4456769.1 hypothetical protein HBH91_098810 [Parastagonospora nodorum]KAH4493510.1 hypothetical protein HBH89_161270 [Parastagonospora nodorum]KAH4545366.1 hypothetical protein HBH85_089940 [Parastagonospora nodorum]